MPSLQRRKLRSAWWLLPAYLGGLIMLSLGWGSTVQADSGSSLFPIPDALRPNVAFWKRVFTELEVNSGVLHDPNDVTIIYHTLYDLPDTPQLRQNLIDIQRQWYRDILANLAAGKRDNLDGDEVRVLSLFQGKQTSEALYAAAHAIRYQGGLRERFARGLARSGAYMQEIEEILASEGVPKDLAFLPHVESSFENRAYSKAGAAGIWQFMPATARRYIRVNSSIDERLDVTRATMAAARFLRENYDTLGTWPLAITAYNHGTNGMKQAVATMGTTDFNFIVQFYRGRLFGFASQNFYAEFLAAMEVARNYRQYFGDIVFDPPQSSWRRWEARVQPAPVPPPTPSYAPGGSQDSRPWGGAPSPAAPAFSPGRSQEISPRVETAAPPPPTYPPASHQNARARTEIVSYPVHAVEQPSHGQDSQGQRDNAPPAPPVQTVRAHTESATPPAASFGPSLSSQGAPGRLDTAPPAASAPQPGRAQDTPARVETAAFEPSGSSGQSQEIRPRQEPQEPSAAQRQRSADTRSRAESVPPATPPPPAIQDKEYRTQQGDTLLSIARQFDTTVETLVALNRLTRRYSVTPGRTLIVAREFLPAGVLPSPSQAVAQAVSLPGRVFPTPQPVETPAAPAGRSPEVRTSPEASPPAVPATPPTRNKAYRVQRGDTFVSIAQRFDTTVQALAALNDVSQRYTVKRGETLVVAKEPLASAATVSLQQPSGDLGMQSATTQAKVRGIAVAPATPPPDALMPLTLVKLSEVARAPATPTMEAVKSASQATIPRLAETSEQLKIQDGTIRVAAQEKLVHYAEWLALPVQRLLVLNRLAADQPPPLGSKVRLDFSKVSMATFTQRRLQYHRSLEEDFLRTHQVRGVTTRTLRPGETFWTLVRQLSDVPLWLLQRYNDHIQLGALRPGSALRIPKVMAKTS